MPVEDYCRAKVALPGSSLYYSVLFAEPRIGASLIALHALAEELREITDETADEDVARRKLAWWAEELERTGAGAARHPVTRALEGPFARAGIVPARFAGVLESAHAHVLRDAYPTLEALEAHHARMAEVLGCAAAALCAGPDAAVEAVSRDLGVGLALADLATAPGRAGARRPTDLPVALLDPGDAGALRASRASPRVARALAGIAACAREHLTAYLEAMPAPSRPHQRPRLALAEMGIARLRALERSGFRKLDRPASATPLRKLWIAWKHRQR